MIRVLGFDPGTRVCGYGVVDFEPESGLLSLVECGTLEPGKGDVATRLSVLGADAAGVIEEFGPDHGALELVHLRHNVQSALRIAEARGVLIGAFAAGGVPFGQYQPSSIKLSAAGSGRASKGQVADAVARVLRLAARPKLDATDALATAICHIRRGGCGRRLSA